MKDRDVPTPLARARRSAWAAAAYLLAFAVLIGVVSVFFLLPAFDAARGADRTGRQQLSAVSMLLLAVVLFICLMGLILTFRFGRFFFPRQRSLHREKTQYVDAWAESAKRMKSPPAEDDDAREE